MSDIVERLRETDWDVCQEAAAEIERLRNLFNGRATYMKSIKADITRAEAVIEAARDMWDKMGDDNCPEPTVADAEGVFEIALAKHDSHD